VNEQRVWRVLGPLGWIVVILFAAPIIACVVISAASPFGIDLSPQRVPMPGPSVSSDKHAHHGSPAYLGLDISYLQPGSRTDSKMKVIDRSLDRRIAGVQAYGCGRLRYLRDYTDWNGRAVSNDTHCNLDWHRTFSQRYVNGYLDPNDIFWGGTSPH
jgi:hypothetical protein